MKETRYKLINAIETIKKGPIIYWMSRDQRVGDNWALLFAQQIALKQEVPLIVVFALATKNLKNNYERHYDFMFEGLKEVEKKLKEHEIPFCLLTGSPVQKVSDFVKKINAGAVVTDFSPLKTPVKWKDEVAKNITIPFFGVDTHNIIPCWEASQQQEYMARTFRPKVHRLIDEYLEEFPSLQKHTYNINVKRCEECNQFEDAYKKLAPSKDVKRIEWIIPGESAALKALEKFVRGGIEKYETSRNDISRDAQSNLSPYLHFGHLSAQRVVLELQKVKKDKFIDLGFFEELVVRKELSDNYCYYNRNYDNYEGFPAWAQKTLEEHKNDPREVIYSLEELEHYQTHDSAWNAAQREMVMKGKMHGYMRMYWAKKILEWAESPKQAQKIAIYLNDKYELDGRDPNGYTGIAWSIGGVHDRAWFERSIFGKIRYMSHGGLERKFDLNKYIEYTKQL